MSETNNSKNLGGQGKSKFSQKEEEILAFWQRNKIFEKTLKKKAPLGEFVFYDGPVTANSKPVLHTMLPFAFKDCLPRYKTMRGYHVRRKGGWDTHGLPVELQIEKKLGLKSKKEIETYGIAAFNKLCKDSVWEYIELWKAFTSRMGYWADQENPYVTYHNEYIESLWNVVSKINDKKLLYKDYKVLPWCPRCGTALSTHELAQGYEDVKDLSVYVKFKIKSLGLRSLEGKGNTYFLAWTTTPWTLPGNVALAVGEKIDYVKIKLGEEEFILAKERLSVMPEGYEILEEMKGKDLVGMEYEPLFPFLKDNLPETETNKLKNAFKVYGADFVNTTDGTGIVHIAPMYGQDDFALGTKMGLPKYHLVKEDGTFKDGCGFLSGRFVKEIDQNGKPTLAVDIIDDLKKRNLFFKQENHKHTYPHCWRCKTPLIYFARDSWYIKMSSLRDKLLSENKKINWEPDYIKDGRFGEWLKDVKDWAISRERYWGTPLPVWTTDDGKERLVVDSIETLKKYTKKSGNKYFLMRHGEATHNLKNILSSDTEEKHPLTEKGKMDAEKAAKKLKKNKIDLIIHSPLIRAKETAEIVSRIIGAPMEEDTRIREEDLGTLSGKDWGKIVAFYPTFEDRLYKKYDGAETLVEIKKRVGEFIYEIENKYQGKNILIVTHDGPIKLLECVAQGVEDKGIKKIYIPGENYLLPGEVEEFFFVPLPHDDEYRLDLHKPYIDEVKLISKKGKEMARVKEVMDVWFDSGCMPFAQDHYPFVRQEKFLKGQKLAYPADFISEAIDQTRGWFYTLHAVGVLMGKGRAYKNVICLGHLNDKDGKKMSKSVGNVIDPWTMVDKYGVDALRLWMYSVNQPGEPKSFDEKTVDEVVKKYFNLLSNVLSFYELYRDRKVESLKLKVESMESKNILDIWILKNLENLVSFATKNIDEYKILEPVREIRSFIDDLSTWYLRRSRDRFRDGDKEAKKTLYFVLKTLAKILAPFAPFYAESLYQSLKTEKDEESVHLENWPGLVISYKLKVKSGILEEMKEVRKICSLALEARQKANIKVRQPLSKLKVESLKLKEEYLEIIKEEVNVKEIIFDETIKDGVWLDPNITPELKEEGVVREFIRSLQDIRKEKGFEAKDRAELFIASSDEFKKLVEKFEREIKKVVGLDQISFVKVAEREITLESFNLSVGVEKNSSAKNL